MGTHTSGQGSDYLQIATVQLPKREGEPGASERDVLDREKYDDERGGSYRLSCLDPLRLSLEPKRQNSAAITI